VDLSLVQPAADTNGLVNLEAVAYTGTGESRFSFSRRLVTSASGTPLLAGPVDTGGDAQSDVQPDATPDPDASPDADAAPDTAPVTANLVLDTGSKVTPVTASPNATDESADPVEDADTPTAITDDYPFVASTDEDDPGPDYDAGVPKACSSTLVKNYGPRWVLVGQTYSSTTKVSHTFVYARGASSTLGVGVSASGDFGSFEQGGTVSKANTPTTSFPTYGDHHGVYYKTQFVYGEYHISCAYPGIAPQDVRYTDRYEVRARSTSRWKRATPTTPPSTTTSTPTATCAAQRGRSAVRIPTGS
jgi:hypothetical protein